MSDPTGNHIKSAPPMAGKLMRGAVWMAAMRWGMRLLGMISMIVLARILMPADFGLIAMAMVVVGIAEALTNTGVTIFLLRNADATRENFDGAWTLQLLQLSLVGLAVIALAPLAADFYDDQRVTRILQVMALAVALRGLENIGVVEFRRQLDFARDFRFNLISKVLGVMVMITLALLFRNYWALVFGQLAATGITVVISYIMSPFRPRFNLKAIGDIWLVSKWIMVRGMAGSVLARAESIILGRLADATVVGYYNISFELSNMIGQEISGPVMRATTPGFAKLNNEPDRLRAAFLRALGAVALLGIPAAIGFATIASEFVTVVLGDKWLAAIPVLQVLAIAAAPMAVTSFISVFLMNQGEERLLAGYSWFLLVFLIVAVWLGFDRFGVVGAAYGRGATSLFSFCLLVFILRYRQGIAVGDVLKILVRPALATTVMALCVYMVGPWMAGSPVGAVLAVKVLAGGAVYAAAIFALWKVFGTDEGFEQRVFQWIGNKFGIQSNR